MFQQKTTEYPAKFVLLLNTYSLSLACSDLEFKEVANRLRDWFKALHESGSQNKKTKALLRPERSSKSFKFG